MTSRVRLSGAVLLVAIGVLMSGCGADRPADQESGASGSATSGAPTPSSPGSPTPATTESPMPTQIPIAAGPVTVRTDAGHYAVGSTLHVTVSNRNDRPAYTTDFKTDCSIVTLQRHDGDAWTNIVGCLLKRPTRIVEVGPGQEQGIDIDPRGSHLSGAAVGAGTYRIEFTYRTDPQPTSGEPMVSYSPEFTIS